MSSKLQQIVEGWIKEEMIPFKMSENSEERELYNSGLKNLQKKIPQLEQSIIDEAEKAISEHKVRYPLSTTELNEEYIRLLLNHLTK